MKIVLEMQMPAYFFMLQQYLEEVCDIFPTHCAKFDGLNFFESWKCDLKYIYIYLLILQTFNEHYRIYGYESLLLLILFQRTVAVHFTATHEASFGIQCLPYWLKLYASVRL